MPNRMRVGRGNPSFAVRKNSSSLGMKKRHQDDRRRQSHEQHQRRIGYRRNHLPAQGFLVFIQAGQLEQLLVKGPPFSPTLTMLVMSFGNVLGCLASASAKVLPLWIDSRTIRQDVPRPRVPLSARSARSGSLQSARPTRTASRVAASAWPGVWRAGPGEIPWWCALRPPSSVRADRAGAGPRTPAVAGLPVASRDNGSLAGRPP